MEFEDIVVGGVLAILVVVCVAVGFLLGAMRCN
jgi:hypothetical protein